MCTVTAVTRQKTTATTTAAAATQLAAATAATQLAATAAAPMMASPSSSSQKAARPHRHHPRPLLCNSGEKRRWRRRRGIGPAASVTMPTTTSTTTSTDATAATSSPQQQRRRRKRLASEAMPARWIFVAVLLMVQTLSSATKRSVDLTTSGAGAGVRGSKSSSTASGISPSFWAAADDDDAAAGATAGEEWTSGTEDRWLMFDDFMDGNDTDTTDGGDGRSGSTGTSQTNPDHQSYEFVAFLLWYMFLVMCCVVPTCCAYKRRRDAEARIAQQHATNMSRIQRAQQQQFNDPMFDAASANNWYLLSSLQQQQLLTASMRRDNELRDQAERVRIYTETLKGTTMEVKDGDWVDEGSVRSTRPMSSVKVAAAAAAAAPPPVVSGTVTVPSAKAGPVAAASVQGENEKDAKDDGKEEEKEDEGDGDASGGFGAVAPAAAYDPLGDTEENAGSLKLPAGAPNGDRVVPATCAVCLCSYENGEEIVWSPSGSCKHCFHKDCIIAWLAKKNEARCPVCRQEFCEGAEVGSSSPVFDFRLVDGGGGFDDVRAIRRQQQIDAALAAGHLQDPRALRQAQNQITTASGRRWGNGAVGGGAEGAGGGTTIISGLPGFFFAMAAMMEMNNQAVDLDDEDAFPASTTEMSAVATTSATAAATDGDASSEIEDGPGGRGQLPSPSAAQQGAGGTPSDGASAGPAGDFTVAAATGTSATVRSIATGTVVERGGAADVESGRGSYDE